MGKVLKWEKDFLSPCKTQAKGVKPEGFENLMIHAPYFEKFVALFQVPPFNNQDTSVLQI